MRILITNDDGIRAAALPVLASRFARDGHDVLVAAPLEGHSGCGASIGQVTEGQRVAVAEVSLPGAAGIAACSIDAPPAFIVLAAVQGVLGPRPDVVITGPNSGLNLGPLVLHSGTVGAAVTASSNGVPGIALSTTKRARHGFATAAEFCARNLATLLASMSADTALNINVPDLPPEAIAGVRRTSFATRSLVAIVLSESAVMAGGGPAVGAAGDPWTGGATDAGGAAVERHMRVALEYDVDGRQHRAAQAARGGVDDSDAGAIIDDCISVTVVHGGLRHVDVPATGPAWQGFP